MCEGCPNRGTVVGEIIGRPFDDERGYAALADSQGGMSDVLDLTRADFANQVTPGALSRAVQECQTPQDVIQDSTPENIQQAGLLRRWRERRAAKREVKPEQICPAIGHLAVTDMCRVPTTSIDLLKYQTRQLRLLDAMSRGLDRANKIRGLR
ncbi:MAG: hypothetical protein JWM81_854 [Candidatus Saccharibacteria bacterium]|nr:hypothetical protein [Candidatus Saccharibacteria bacterium]